MRTGGEVGHRQAKGRSLRRRPPRRQLGRLASRTERARTADCCPPLRPPCLRASVRSSPGQPAQTRQMPPRHFKFRSAPVSSGDGPRLQRDVSPAPDQSTRASAGKGPAPGRQGTRQAPVSGPAPAWALQRSDSPPRPPGTTGLRREAGSTPWKEASERPFLPLALQDAAHKQQTNTDTASASWAACRASKSGHTFRAVTRGLSPSTHSHSPEGHSV